MTSFSDHNISVGAEQLDDGIDYTFVSVDATGPLRMMRNDAQSARQFAYCALIQVSDPVSLTATSVKKIRSGLPSPVPRWSRETNSGPTFL
jgi:hypothetical protein